MSGENFKYVNRGKVNYRSQTGSSRYQGNQSSNEGSSGQYVRRNFNRVVVRATQTRRKSSRTLLLKEVGDREFTYEGLQQVEKSPQGNLFLVFDTLDNSRKAFKDLRINKVNCKYSYYKLFFKTTNLDTNKSYDELKSSFLKLLSDTVSGLNVLYFKYYRKEGNFTGSGDFVVDRKVDCDSIVKARTLKLGESELTYYRYRTNRLQSGQAQSNVEGQQGSGTEGNNSEEETR